MRGSANLNGAARRRRRAEASGIVIRVNQVARDTQMGAILSSPKFGNMLLEQFGGANGELAAAMQYSIQELNRLPPKVG